MGPTLLTATHKPGVTQPAPVCLTWEGCLENAALNASWTASAGEHRSPACGSPLLFVLADALPDDLLDLRIMHLLKAGRLDTLRRTEQSYLAPPRAEAPRTPWPSLLPRALPSLRPGTHWGLHWGLGLTELRAELCSGAGEAMRQNSAKERMMKISEVYRLLKPLLRTKVST